MDDLELDREIEKMIRVFRIVGWLLLVVGGISAVATIYVVAGSPAKLSAKAPTIAFVLMLPLIGAFFAFNPKENIVSSFRRMFQRVRGSTEPDSRRR